MRRLRRDVAALAELVPEVTAVQRRLQLLSSRTSSIGSNTVHSNTVHSNTVHSTTVHSNTAGGR